MTTTLYSSFNSKFDINHLAESVEIECKLARGKDGNGAVPKSFWESYSAMANTYGGTILLGVEERKAGGFVWQGVKNHAKVIDDLWNTLRNKDKISINLLKEKDIRVIDENPDLPPLIAINIPQASRKAKPVYVGRNPLTGTYVRVNEGDYKTSEEDVRRMIAENVEDSRDEYS